MGFDQDKATHHSPDRNGAPSSRRHDLTDEHYRNRSGAPGVDREGAFAAGDSASARDHAELPPGNSHDDATAPRAAFVYESCWRRAVRITASNAKAEYGRRPSVLPVSDPGAQKPATR